MENILFILSGIFWFSVVILVSVGIHEFGHYIVARVLGCKVLEYSIGMGKEVFGYTSKKSGIRYKLSILPIGGYVKLLSDSEKKQNPEYQHLLSFVNEAKWKQNAVLSAGVIMNLLLAVMLFAFVLFNNTTTINTEIRYISPDIPYSTATESKLSEGDVIKSVDKTDINGIGDLAIILTSKVGDSQVELVTSNEKTILLNLEEIKIEKKGDSALTKIGLNFYDAPFLNIVSSASDYFKEKGVVSGDSLVSIDGVRTNNLFEIKRQLNKKEKDKGILLDFEGANGTYQIDFPPNEGGWNNEVRVLGLSFGKHDFKRDVITDYKIDIFQSIEKGWDASILQIKSSFIIFGKIASNDISPQTMGGAITIGDYAKKTADTGLYSFIWFMASFNISLLVMNILPIPVLDGGHIMINIIESTLRIKISEKYSKIISIIGLSMILSLMIFTIGLDIKHYILGN